MSFDIFEGFIKDAQQTVYNQSGEEYQMLQNTGLQQDKKVLMPTNQNGSPQTNVVVVDEYELSEYSDTPPGYGAQPAQTAKLLKMAQEGEENIDWSDIYSLINDVIIEANRKNLRGVMDSLEYLTSNLLMYIDLPGDLKVFGNITKTKMMSYLKSLGIQHLKNQFILVETNQLPNSKKLS
jgi:hypothetical protein